VPTPETDPPDTPLSATTSNDGTPTARHTPAPPRRPLTDALIARRTNLPTMDRDALRSDIDEATDQSL